MSNFDINYKKLHLQQLNKPLKHYEARRYVGAEKYLDPYKAKFASWLKKYKYLD